MLEQKFKQALVEYLTNQDDQSAKDGLLAAAFQVCHEVLSDSSLENEPEAGVNIEQLKVTRLGATGADEQLVIMADFLDGCSLETIKPTIDQLTKFDQLIQDIEFENNIKNAFVAHLLSTTYHMHLNRDENVRLDKIREQLTNLRIAVENLPKRGTSKSILEATGKLAAIMQPYFQLKATEKKAHYPKMAADVRRIILTAKQEVRNELIWRTVLYNLLAAIVGLGVFYGIYIVSTARQRHSLFIQPQLARDVEKLNDLDDKLSIDV